MSDRILDEEALNASLDNRYELPCDDLIHAHAQAVLNYERHVNRENAQKLIIAYHALRQRIRVLVSEARKEEIAFRNERERNAEIASLSIKANGS